METSGEDSSEVTVELTFGPHSVDAEMPEQSGADRSPAEEGIDATLESIRRRIEGEGGKVQPPPPLHA